MYSAMRLFKISRCIQGTFRKINFLSIFNKNHFIMAMVILVYALLVLAIISPWIFPNKLVSKHKKDLEV